MNSRSSLRDYRCRGIGEVNGEDDVILPVRKRDFIESRHADAGFAHARVAHFDDADARTTIHVVCVIVVASFATADEPVAADCGAGTRALTGARKTRFDCACAGATIIVCSIAIIACFHADACSITAIRGTRTGASARAGISSFDTAVGSTTVTGHGVTVVAGFAACCHAISAERSKRDLELVGSERSVVAKLVDAREIRAWSQVTCC